MSAKPKKSAYKYVFPNNLLVRKVDVLFIKQWAWCELLSTQHKAHGQHIVRNNRLNEMSACRRTDLMILSAHWLAARQALITTFVDCVMFSKMFITIAYSQSLLFTRRIRQVRMILDLLGSSRFSPPLTTYARTNAGVINQLGNSERTTLSKMLTFQTWVYVCVCCH